MSDKPKLTHRKQKEISTSNEKQFKEEVRK